MSILDRIFRRRYNYRSAITGKFVSKAYAEAHPAECIRERVK